MLTNATDAPSSSSFRFVFVRHPLRRVASAYLSKFAPKNGDGDGDDQERAAFLRPLLRFLRRRSKEGRLPRRAGIGFPDFVDFVVDELQRDKVCDGQIHPFFIPINVCPFRIFQGVFRHLPLVPRPPPVRRVPPREGAKHGGQAGDHGGGPRIPEAQVPFGSGERRRRRGREEGQRGGQRRKRVQVIEQ